MKVLLSIKPEFADKIFSGEKHYEFRKTLFKNSTVKTIVVYATKPVGKIVGEFSIDKVISDKPTTLWDSTAPFSGITKNFFFEYFKGRDMGYAIKVKTVKRYNSPLNLNEVLPNGYIPQSFCYIR